MKSKENQKIEMLYNMMLIRTFEEQISQMKMNDRIYGSVHCCIGEEAVAVGICSALSKQDYVISTHRPHGHAIAARHRNVRNLPRFVCSNSMPQANAGWRLASRVAPRPIVFG